MLHCSRISGVFWTSFCPVKTESQNLNNKQMGSILKSVTFLIIHPSCESEAHLSVCLSADVVLQHSCRDQYCSYFHEFCGVKLGVTRCLCRALFAETYTATNSLGTVKQLWHEKSHLKGFNVSLKVGSDICLDQISRRILLVQFDNSLLTTATKYGCIYLYFYSKSPASRLFYHYRSFYRFYLVMIIFVSKYLHTEALNEHDSNIFFNAIISRKCALLSRDKIFSRYHKKTKGCWV